MKKAMILAAGRGARLKPLTDSLPKPLVTIAGKPLIEHQLAWLAAVGVDEVVINLHHLGELIVETLGDGSRFGLRIVYSPETQALETGGGIVNALPLLGSDPFLLINGDIFTDFPLPLLPNHLPPNAAMHVVLTPTPAFRDRGDFDFDGQWVTARGKKYVYCCIAIIDPVVFSGESRRTFSLRDTMFTLIDEGRLSGQEWSGYWTDIGTLDQLKSVQAKFPPG